MCVGQPKELVACAQCGTVFEKYKHKKYCSFRCRDIARNRRNGMAPKSVIADRPCAKCGNIFKPASSRHGRYCTRDCAFADIKSWNVKPPLRQRVQKAIKSRPGPHCRVRFNQCIECGQSFTSRSAKKICKACANIGKKSRLERGCGICGKAFMPSSKTSLRYCSKKCAQSVLDSAKRIAKAKRRALIKAVTVESVDPFQVFDRDGWHCQICGVHTPRVKRGTYDDDAPELDHVVPIAKGGDHSYANTQCACRKCNSYKSDKIYGGG